MAEIVISQELYDRIKDFKQVVETVMQKEIGSNECAELILTQGLDSMLAELLGSVEQTTMLKSFQQLAAQYPEQVYRYISETLKRGAAVREQESVERQIGFTIAKESAAKQNDPN